MLDFFKKKKDKEKKEVGASESENQPEQNLPEQSIDTKEAEDIAPQEEPKAEVSKKGWFGKLKQGLGKSSSKINDGVKNIFVRKKLDDETLEELEDLLIMSDLGVETATLITTNLSQSKYDKEITPEEIKQILASEIENILKPVCKPIAIDENNKPHVILMCGVNGTGKTTTIGKIANKYVGEGKKVLFAACDTFRAAAVEQLEVWAQRANCPIVTGKEGADPASVAYEALERAKSENFDILIIDTAGRLQNKKNLMEQLAKVVRVIKKLDESAPHDNVIVLDSTTGQNANSQVKLFGEMIDITGIIVTKLDGTAKGGVVVSLAKQFALPIHAVGVGESIDDLNPFEAKDFADGLVGNE